MVSRFSVYMKSLEIEERMILKSKLRSACKIS
ncbi:unnamed protein product, partial [marine sediment metagenome]